MNLVKLPKRILLMVKHIRSFNLKFFFYKYRYTDLRKLSYSDLKVHWNTYGRFEGRVLGMGFLQLTRVYFDSKKLRDYFNSNIDIPFHSRYKLALHYISFAERESRSLVVYTFDINAITKLQNRINSFLGGSQVYLTPCLSQRALYDQLCIASLNNRDIREIFLDNKRILKFYNQLSLSSINPEQLGIFAKGEISHKIKFFMMSLITNSEFIFSLIHSRPSKIKRSVKVLGKSHSLEDYAAQKNFKGSHIYLNNSDEVLVSSNLFLKVSNTNVRISIITSIFNSHKYLDHFLENILGLDDFERTMELIIVDANNDHRELDYVKQRTQKFSNIKFIKTNYKDSIYKCWNIAIQNASGTYLTNANVDDYKLPNSLCNVCNFLDKYPFFDVCYSDYIYYDNFPYVPNTSRFWLSNLPQVSECNLLSFNSPHSSPVWKRTIHNEVGFFDESLFSAGDWEFWLRCKTQGINFYKYPEPLFGYFLNPNGLSTSDISLGEIEQWPIRSIYSGIFYNFFEVLDVKNVKLDPTSQPKEYIYALMNEFLTDSNYFIDEN